MENDIMKEDWRFIWEWVVIVMDELIKKIINLINECTVIIFFLIDFFRGLFGIFGADSLNNFWFHWFFHSYFLL